MPPPWRAGRPRRYHPPMQSSDSRRPPRSWLGRRVMQHAHGRSKAVHAADRLQAFDRDPRQPAAMRRWKASLSAAWVSSVTALATSRPPDGKSVPRPDQHRRIAGAAAQEHGTRHRQRGKYLGRHALAHKSSRGTPSDAALRPARSRRSRRRSTATAFAAGQANSHSMDTEPDPQPMSHSISSGAGRRLASVIARISAFVIWPSCSNQSSDRPGTLGRARASALRLRPPPPIRFSGPISARSNPPAVAARHALIRSAERFEHMQLARPEAVLRHVCRNLGRRVPRPRSGPTAVPRCRRWGRSVSSGRPHSVTVSTSGSDQPRRPAARATEETCGTAIISAAGTYAWPASIRRRS